MDITLNRCDFHGRVDEIISSKSHAHRLLISAALADSETKIYCNSMSKDIGATIISLNALGADIKRKDNNIIVSPIVTLKNSAILDCDESGSTLRFLLPVAGVLGAECKFIRRGKLSQRPLSPLYEELTEHGMTFRENNNGELSCSGMLTSGKYSVAGNISSQFITGLLFSLPLLNGDSIIEITGDLQSKSYIDMTLQVLSQFSININTEKNSIYIKGNQKYLSPGNIKAEGDWSGASFWLVAGALSQQGVKCCGLSDKTHQGDKKILDILEKFGAIITISDNEVTVKKGTLNGVYIDAADIPDAVPVLSVLAAAAKGKTTITNTKRLRYKECDRVDAIDKMLSVLGAEHFIYENAIEIIGVDGFFCGGVIDSFKDHRIAMSAAIAAINTKSGITIKNSECVCKSYPDFFDIFNSLCH